MWDLNALKTKKYGSMVASNSKVELNFCIQEVYIDKMRSRISSLI